MQEEHPLEVERLAREGRLEALRAPRPSRALYIGAVGVGFLALLLGLSLIGLVIWALVSGG